MTWPKLTTNCSHNILERSIYNNQESFEYLILYHYFGTQHCPLDFNPYRFLLLLQCFCLYRLQLQQSKQSALIQSEQICSFDLSVLINVVYYNKSLHNSERCSTLLSLFFLCLCVCGTRCFLLFLFVVHKSYYKFIMLGN